MRSAGLTIVAAVLALLAAGPGSSVPAGEVRALPLTIAFTGDVSGYLEPCG